MDNLSFLLVSSQLCVYGPQSGRTAAEKEHFYDDLRTEWDLHSVGELQMQEASIPAKSSWDT